MAWHQEEQPICSKSIGDTSCVPFEHLLVLSFDYPPNDGGISRLTAGAVGAMTDLGVQTKVVTLSQQMRLGIDRPPSEVIEIDRRKGIRDWQLFGAVRAHIEEFGSNAPILASVWNPEATLATLAGAKRISILAHGNEIMPYTSAVVKSKIRKMILERSRVVICNSGYTENLVKSIASASRTAVVNPAVDVHRFPIHVSKCEARRRLGLPLDARILLTVARLDATKGHETVLRTLASLPQDQRDNFYYVIAGKGPARDSLVSLTNELRLSAHVKFAGFVPDPVLAELFVASDLFVLTSVVDRERRSMEGYGMALTEAQAAGLPVIGTRSGGIPDAVREGEGGWLIGEREVGELKCHLQRLVCNPSLFIEQGKLGLQRVRREMSWRSYAQRLLTLI